VAEYKLQILDGDGRIMAETDAEFANDNQALAAAMIMLAEGVRAEIWSGSRYVGTVAAPSDS
jgi:hypothetical protein